MTKETLCVACKLPMADGWTVKFCSDSCHAAYGSGFNDAAALYKRAQELERVDECAAVRLRARRYADALEVRKVNRDWPALQIVVDWLRELAGHDDCPDDNARCLLPSCDEIVGVRNTYCSRVCTERGGARP